MKKGKNKCGAVYAALCAGMLLTRSILVYGATDEEIAAVREAQAQLQAEQNAHNQAIARENREAVEAENARKVAEQYAAMGIAQEETAENSTEMEKSEEKDTEKNERDESEFFLEEIKSEEAKEAWSERFEGQLTENVTNMEIGGEIPEETLSVLFQALTINEQHVTEVTFDELKELYPMNHAVFARKEHVKDRVRYGDKPDFFGFEFLAQWEDNVLSVVYTDTNEEGNFMRLVFDAESEIRKANWWWRNFYDIYGDDGNGIAQFYDLGHDGFTGYILKQKCFSAEAFMELNGIEAGDLQAEKKEDGAYFEYGEYTSEYGNVLLFYYHDKAAGKSDLFMYFQEEDSVYDYIAVSDFRVEIKLK